MLVMVPLTLIMLMYFLAILLTLGKFQHHYLHGKAPPKFHWLVGLLTFVAIFVTALMHAFRTEDEATRWCEFGIASGLVAFGAFLAFGLPTPPRGVNYGPIQPARSLQPPRSKATRRITDPKATETTRASASGKGAA
jgi:hypothetical protein